MIPFHACLQEREPDRIKTKMVPDYFSSCMIAWESNMGSRIKMTPFHASLQDKALDGKIKILPVHARWQEKASKGNLGSKTFP
jgi:hypothetical protein